MSEIFVGELRQGCFVTPFLVRTLRSSGFAHNLRWTCFDTVLLGYHERSFSIVTFVPRLQTSRFLRLYAVKMQGLAFKKK